MTVSKSVQESQSILLHPDLGVMDLLDVILEEVSEENVTDSNEENTSLSTQTQEPCAEDMYDDFLKGLMGTLDSVIPDGTINIVQQALRDGLVAKFEECITECKTLGLSETEVEERIKILTGDIMSSIGK